jgi:hypothetical protein
LHGLGAPEEVFRRLDRSVRYNSSQRFLLRGERSRLAQNQMLNVPQMLILPVRRAPACGRRLKAPTAIRVRKEIEYLGHELLAS